MKTFDEATFGWIGQYIGLTNSLYNQSESVNEFAARHALARVSDAVAVFLYGSAGTKEFAAFSDIDLLCLVEGRDRLEKHQFIAEGCSFELTVLSNSLLSKLPQLTQRFGTPVGLYALSQGQLIAGEIPSIEGLQKTAVATLADLRHLSSGREDILRRDVLRDMMAIAKTDDDPKRMLHAINILHRIARYTVQDDLRQKFVSRSAINGLERVVEFELHRTLCLAAASYDWRTFSKAVHKHFFKLPMAWDHISRLL